MSNFPTFDIELDGCGRRSRVWMNGVELTGVKEIEIRQGMHQQPMVTLTFASAGVNQTTKPQEPAE